MRGQLSVVLVAAVLGVAAGAPAIAFELRPTTCPGDCDNDYRVTVEELVKLVRFGLGDSAGTCANRNEPRRGIAALVRAVDSALYSCGIPVTYRLDHGSSILYSPSPPTGTAPSIEPLSGTLTVVDSYDSSFPNTLLALSIVGADFRSAEHVATIGGQLNHSCASVYDHGCLTVLTLDFPPILYAGMGLILDGEAMRVGGGQTLEERPMDRFPPLGNVQLCGGLPPQNRFIPCDDFRSGWEAGVILTINASVEESPTPTAP